MGAFHKLRISLSGSYHVHARRSVKAFVFQRPQCSRPPTSADQRASDDTVHSRGEVVFIGDKWLKRRVDTTVQSAHKFLYCIKNVKVEALLQHVTMFCKF